MTETSSIRSITLHLPKPKTWDIYFIEDYIEEWSYKLLEANDKISSENKEMNISSLRITLPNAPLEILRDLKELSLKSDEVLVNIGGLPSEYKELEDLVASLAREGFYSHIVISEPEWEKLRRIAKLLNTLSEEDPELATKFGINLSGEEILTPFYPLSWSPGKELVVTTCLTYPNALYKAYRDSGLRGMKERARELGEVALKVAKKFANELEGIAGGVDLSVAPWMENSSLGLIEGIAGVRLPEPGIAYGIFVVNKILKELKNVLKLTGFNEVQLPVGEDLKLKARASEGELKARDLARLSGACLAGLDMVAIPFDEIKVAGLMLEVLSYSREGKLLGFRAIVLDGVEPGDRVSTRRFGEIPVIAI